MIASREIIDSVNRAWFILTAVSVILLVGIMIALVVFVVKYRRSRNPEVSDIHGNMKLEFIWTVLPTILVAWLFFVGYEGFALMRDVPDDAYVVECLGRQWYWTFRYPQEDISSAELYVPVNKPIKVRVSAPENEVLHSLYIPYFKVKEDCVPGKWSYVWFEADKIGTYNVFCTEFCGKDHARMITKLHVVSQDEFNGWLDKKLQERYLPVDIPNASNPQSELILARKGSELFRTYCASCHGTEGQGGLVEGARNFQSLEKWKRSPKVTDIYRTLELGLEGTQMRSFANLAPWDRLALAHHVASFNQSPERPQPTQADWEALVKEFSLDKPPTVTREFPIDEAMEAIAKEAD
jgi:cytochrome c oxidase subunit II